MTGGLIFTRVGGVNMDEIIKRLDERSEALDNVSEIIKNLAIAWENLRKGGYDETAGL